MSVVTDSSVLASTLQRLFLLHGLVPTLGAGAGAWNTHGYKRKLQLDHSYLKLKNCSQNNNQIITRYWSATKIDFISFWLYGNMNEISDEEFVKNLKIFIDKEYLYVVWQV